MIHLLYSVAGENVGRHEQMRVQRTSSRIDTDFQVAERGTFVTRVSELEKIRRGSRYGRNPDLDEAIAIASLQHLYFRHLLNIGDSGTHNILVREDRATSGRSIAGIDFDEHRRWQETRTALGYLFKKEYSYLEAIYGSYLPQVVRLREIDTPLQSAIDELNRLYRKWVSSLPPARATSALSEGVIQAQDLLERDQQLWSLVPAGH